MAIQTANGVFKYNQVFEGKTLNEWVDLCHRSLSSVSHWVYRPLKIGSFGYDNMAVSIGTAMSSSKMSQNLEDMAEKIHDGWVVNYVYRRDHKPYINGPYIKPAQSLGDKRREQCAQQPYQSLPEDEKEKDRVIARVLIGSSTNPKPTCLL